MTENKLHLEKSLYLRQHAENPIHWWPYGTEALNKAKELNKLIFLSVGYSSCHWCHVMAHESFEDEVTANYLNENFISIKVDREEYPDLDNYYQNVCSLMTGRGGWPLTIFLTPDAKPFIAGTYFPKLAREGMPSFMDLLKHIHQLKTSGDQTIYENADKIVEELKKPFKLENKIEFKGHFPAPSAIMNALKNYADVTNGGYGKAPKFPHYPFFEWACEQILEGMIPKEQGQHIVETVEKMMMGGVYDHAKGGIHRYSVDDQFLVPHFEKMLYDQAGLLKVLAKLSQFYPSPLIYDGILQTLDYLQTEMVSEEGYFFSSQDADSEGQEGLYFTFTKDEFEASFESAPEDQKAKLEKYLKYFNITEAGNFEQQLNVLSLNPAYKADFYEQDSWQEIREIRRRLLEQRKLRIPPSTDRKGIAGWNYMILSALADVAQYCAIDVIQNQALNLIHQTVEGCLKQFIVTDAKTGKHIIRHVNTLESQALYLEDYVNFSDAQLRLYEISGNEIFKKNALETIDYIIQNFIQDKRVYLTAVKYSTTGFDNLVAPTFDQSYRSSVMTFVLLLNRVSVLDPKFSPEEIFGENYQEFAQFALSNPLGHGEGLRALTYPHDIYRKIEVPQAWIDHKEFREMRNHFFSRFILTYHGRDEESFQICTRTSCEVEGKGLNKFKALFQIQEAQNE
jgi:uncharacterized protein YyaL (SSP411 family)